MIDLSSFRVILIAGVSGSGKTELARRLRRENLEFSTFNMDVVLDALDIANLPLGAEAHSDHQHNVRVMQVLGPALCQSVLHSAERTIIDGGWVDPGAWERLSHSNSGVAALYLGYPTASADEVLTRLSQTSHWLAGAQDRSFVMDEIQHSISLKGQVSHLSNAAFLDVSEDYISDEELLRVLIRLSS